MTAINPIVVRFDVDASGLRRAVSAASDAGRDIRSRMGGFGASSGRAFSSGMRGAFRGLGGALVAVGGFTAAFSGIKNSIQSLARIEVINKQTDARIKSMGNAAGVSAKHVQDLAGSLENATATEAETIQEGENLLLTFGNIKNVGADKIFDDTTKAMVDLSRGMNQDVKSSAIQLGKALDNPIKGMTALSRVGVSFSEQEKAQIKALQESGNIVGAQKIILASVNRQFGGAGEAYANTLSGTVDLIKHSLGTIGETIMGKAMPGLNTLAKKGLEGLRGFADKLPAIMDSIATKFGPFFENMKPVFDNLGKSIGPLLPNLMTLVSAFSPLAQLLPAIAPLLPQIVAALTNVISIIGPVLMDTLSTIIPSILELINVLGPVLGEVLAILLPIIGQLVQILGPVLGDIIVALAPPLLKIVEVIAALLIPVLQFLAPIVVTVAQFIGALVDGIARFLSDLLGWAGSLLGIQAPSASGSQGFGSTTATTNNYYNVSAPGLTTEQVHKEAAKRAKLTAPVSTRG